MQLQASCDRTGCPPWRQHQRFTATLKRRHSSGDFWHAFEGVAAGSLIIFKIIRDMKSITMPASISSQRTLPRRQNVFSPSGRVRLNVGAISLGRKVGSDLRADRSPRGGPGTSRPTGHCGQPHPVLITPLQAKG